MTQDVDSRKSSAEPVSTTPAPAGVATPEKKENPMTTTQGKTDGETNDKEKDMDEEKDKGKDKEVSVFVGDDEVTTPKKTTPAALLVAAGLDPSQRQLVRINGKHQEPFEDPNAEITVHQGERFVTVSTGNTPVS